MLWIKHGLSLKRVLFERSSWLNPYIMFNTMLRKVARNVFEKGFFKFMDNSVFGETMEKICNHIGIKLETNYANKQYMN